MIFLAGFLDTLGTVISHVLNIYASYKQIEDRSDTRQRYEYHEYHHYERRDTGEDISAIKEMVEKKLIPCIKETTEVVRNAMKEFADSGQQLAKQIKDQLIPGAKTTIKATEDAMNELSKTSSLLGAEISDAAEQLQICLEIGIIFLLLAVAIFCRYELSMIERESEQNTFHRIEKTMIHILRCTCISYGAMRFVVIILLKQAEPVPNEVLFLTFIPVLICLSYDVVKQSNFKLSKPDTCMKMIFSYCGGLLQNTGKYAVSCVDFIIERITVISQRVCCHFKLIQGRSAQRIRCIKHYILMILRHIGNKLAVANFKPSMPDIKMILCGGLVMIKCLCDGLINHVGTRINVILQRFTVTSEHVCYYSKLFQGCSAQRIRCIKDYILMILKRQGDKLVTAINVERLSLFIWLPQNCFFPLLNLKNQVPQP